jgi:PAS domain S-box-containing protein
LKAESRLRRDEHALLNRIATPPWTLRRIFEIGSAFGLQTGETSMRTKPSYEELQQKVADLEKQLIEAKKSEAALHFSEQSYRDLYENAPIAYLSISPSDGSILRFNSEAVRLLGYKREMLAQMKVLELYADTEHGVSRAMALFERFQAGESVRDQELQMKRSDGRLIWVNLNIEPVKSSGGDVIESRSMVIDISARKQAENSLSESEAKFRALAESAPAVIIILAGEDFIYVNPAFESISGFNQEEALSMQFWDLIHPDMQELVKERGLARQRGKTVPAHYELQAITKDGRKIWLDMAAASINFGGQTATLAMAYDITDRIKTERALREKDDKLERQAKNLLEVNTALKVLLERREKEKAEIKETLLANMKKLVYPYIEKLENKRLDEDTNVFVNIIKTNLDDLLSPLTSTLSTKFFALTPSEIQVADLIKHGKTSKEIAATLNISPNAVSFHRGNLRKKLGLSNKKINLRAYLHTFPH